MRATSPVLGKRTVAPPRLPPAAPLAAPLAAPSSAPSTARFHDKREALLNAAAALFNERGVKGATLAEIAASVGLASNSVTYYYRRKEDLARECFLRSIAALQASAEAAAQLDGVAPRLQHFFELLALSRAEIDSGRRPPLVWFNDIRALPSPQSDAVFAAYTTMFRRVRDLLKGPHGAALSRAELNARGHIVLSVALWMQAWINRHETAAYSRVAARVADVLVAGMAGAAASTVARGASIDSGIDSGIDSNVNSDIEPESNGNWSLGVGASASNPMDAFLRAATYLVNEQGYRGTSVDRISARLNVTKGSFYHHNDNKQDLISACFERSFTVLREALSMAESSSGSGWQRVCAAAHALLRYQLSEHGPLLRASATSALPDAARRERVRQTMSQLTERLGGVIVEGMMDGSIRPLDPAIAAECAIGAINAAAELHRWLPNQPDDCGGLAAERIVGLYLRPVFEGVLCPPAAALAAANCGS